MKAIILVAGEGKRLQPYTLSRPKCLVEIRGKPLIEYQIQTLKNVGISNIILVGGYKAEMLAKYATTFYTNERYYETNMLWTLFCAQEEIVGDIIVSYGDIIYSSSVLHKLISAPGEIVTVIDSAWRDYWNERFSNPLEDAETLQIDGRGFITNIGQKPVTLEDIQGQYIGLTKFTLPGTEILRQVFERANEAQTLNGKHIEKAYMTDILQEIINLKHEVTALRIEGQWIEIDTVKDLHIDITKKRLSNITDLSY